MKLPRLALQLEMSWHNSLILSVEQFVVTQLSELLGCRLNMDVLKCQLRDSSLFVSNVPIGSSTLRVADHHSRCCQVVDSRVVAVGDHV